MQLWAFPKVVNHFAVVPGPGPHDQAFVADIVGWTQRSKRFLNLLANQLDAGFLIKAQQGRGPNSERAAVKLRQPPRSGNVRQEPARLFLKIEF